MAKFFYQAYTRNREKTEGVLEAESHTHVVEKLDKLALFPISIRLHNEQSVASRGIRRGRITAGDIALFTRQISNLLDAGLTILASLLIVSRQTTKLSLKFVIDKIVDDLKEGKTFSQSLAAHGRSFSPLYIALVHSGEVGGFLEEVMRQLADFLENEEEIKNKVRSAMIYPAIIACVGVLTVFILLSFVIPRLVVVFEDFEQQLPLPTQILISISHFVHQLWWLALIGIALVIFVAGRVLKTHEGRFAFHRLQLQMPVLGQIILQQQLERFSRILATLLGSGITILPSLEIVRDVMENELLKQEVERMRLDVRDGSSITAAMNKTVYFPDTMKNIVAVGEESGSLEKVLKKVSANYERNVDRALKVFVSLLEPLTILVMGSVVAFIVIALLLPIFQINFMAR